MSDVLALGIATSTRGPDVEGGLATTRAERAGDAAGAAASATASADPVALGATLLGGVGSAATATAETLLEGTLEGRLLWFVLEAAFSAEPALVAVVCSRPFHPATTPMPTAPARITSIAAMALPGGPLLAPARSFVPSPMATDAPPSLRASAARSPARSPADDDDDDDDDDDTTSFTVDARTNDGRS